MSDSDLECYEELDGVSPPPVSTNGGHFPFNKSRSMTHTGIPENRKSVNSSHFPPDIDKRPPYPIPKGASKSSQHNTSSSPGHLNYNQIIVSPVAPDYELSSVSPPRNSGYGMPICGQQLHQQQSTMVDDRPPVPPINPHRKPPTRYGALSQVTCMDNINYNDCFRFCYL